MLPPSQKAVGLLSCVIFLFLSTGPKSVSGRCHKPQGGYWPDGFFDEEGVRKNCNPDGTVSSYGCPTAADSTVLMKWGQTWEELETTKICEQQAARVVNCIKASNTLVRVPIGMIYDDGFARKKCTSRGVRIINCIVDGHSAKTSVFVDYNYVVKRCTPRGMKPIACEYAGMRKHFDETIEVNGVWKRCTPDGLKALNCKAPDGTVVEFGHSSVAANGLRSDCTDHGLVQRGCVADNADLAFGQEHDDTTAGMVKLCTEHSGLVPSKCIWHGQRYALSEPIDFGKFRMRCTTSGVVGEGCLYHGGPAVVMDGQKQRFGDLTVKCDGGHGIVPLFCDFPGGEQVQYGATAADRLHINHRCTDDGLKAIGCKSSSGTEVGFGELFWEGRAQMKCTEAGPEPYGCNHSDGRHFNVGEHYDDPSGLVMECDASGQFQKRGCRKEDGQLAPIGGPAYREHGLLKTCDENGGVSTQECFLEDGSTLKKGKLVVVNGLQKRCNEDGLENVGCPGMEGKLQPVRSVFELNNMKYDCTSSGAIPVACGWINDEWKPIGAEVDQMGVTRNCTPTGWNSIGCPDNFGKLVPISKNFVKNSFSKKCTELAAEVLGCYFHSTILVEVDVEIKVRGLKVKCTVDGVHLNGCPSDSGDQPVDEEYEEGGVVKKCTAAGVQLLGCPSSSGTQKFDQSFEDKGMVYDCTNTGAVPTHCKWEGGDKAVQETFVVAGVQRICTPTGIVVQGCPGDNGELAPLNHEFTLNGFRKTCTEEGANVHGCYTSDGSLLPLQQKKVDKRGIEIICEESGVKDLGCPTDQGTTAALNSQFEDKNAVRYDCTNKGPVSIGCIAAKDHTFVARKQTIDLESGLRLRCGKHGWQKLGCVQEDSQLAPVGTDFQDEEFVYHCTDNGAEVWGCVDKSGSTHANGEEFVEMGLMKRCNLTSDDGITYLGCIVNGREVPMDARAEEVNGPDDSRCRHCTTSGILFDGCIMGASVSWRHANPIDALNEKSFCEKQEKIEGGKEVIIGDVKKSCLPVGLQFMTCFYKNKELPLGTTVPENGADLECTADGMQEKKGRKRFKVPIAVPELKPQERDLEIQLYQPDINQPSQPHGVEEPMIGKQRTAILIQKTGHEDPVLFLRGGISHKLNKACKGKKAENSPCAIPISHTTKVGKDVEEDYNSVATGDNHLDWYGAEQGQGPYKGRPARGTPLVLTSSESNNADFNPLNTFGNDYYLVEVEMDCSKTNKGWFEFKAVDHSGIFESDLQQTKCQGASSQDKQIDVPFASINHVGRCGYVNVFSFGSSECTYKAY